MLDQRSLAVLAGYYDRHRFRQDHNQRCWQKFIPNLKGSLLAQVTARLAIPGFGWRCRTPESG
jgi:hypothetical protein